MNLTLALIDTGAVPRQAADGAAHIATAVTNGVDFLVTRNFRHIADTEMRVRIEQVCRGAGYDPPVTCTPNELIEANDEQEPNDPIISEVQAVRDAHAARFHYDLVAIFRDNRQCNKNSV